mmetsp:Transcript_34179/g.58034  ORF Transcript_34179/g.58034 Transcript_34179/m.58034 type:complete len:435 (+) Transcript_34179:148-1452(+)|eukprot:CAMPEP_0183707846 /NCGR_PEP_ID=MMETSP0737-20130205/4284_1 /TAXON_ID=385413 /ORGANISM="Thalassiosira miniscula, Strain CCMP1093" /LENGTH=434 /DNA_ID=CAMNT_0025935577 /DNA_START=76 /DNA_END=1380 /DNA_ORIENTATION=+
MHFLPPSALSALLAALAGTSTTAFAPYSLPSPPPSAITHHQQHHHHLPSAAVTTTTTALHARKSSNNDKDENADEEEDAPPAINPAKKAALDGVLSRIERNYGRGSIVTLGDADRMVVDCVGSGSMTLDAALGGGYPKGRVIEIYGPESSGKTTLALHALAEVQQSGGIAAFVDAEHALDPAYAAALGVDVDALLVSQPDSGEMALDIVDQLVRSSAVDVIVVDSVAALVPRAELEGGMDDMQVGLQARLMSKALRKITSSLSLSQCTVIFLNQLRSKVGVIYGSPEVTSGGNALKFYASVRLDTRRREVLPDNMGIRAKVKVVKNKVAAPFKVVELDILFGEGIDKMGSLLDAALDLGVVQRKGSWYSYQDSNFAQGRFNAGVYLKGNRAVAKKMEEEVREALLMAKRPDSDESIEDGDLASSIISDESSVLE